MGTENPRSIRYWNVVQYFKYSLKFSNSVSFSSSNPANQISRNHTLHLSLSLTHWIHFITKFCWLYFLNISQTHPFLFPLYCSYHEKLTSTLPWTKSDRSKTLVCMRVGTKNVEWDKTFWSEEDSSLLCCVAGRLGHNFLPESQRESRAEAFMSFMVLPFILIF